MRLGSIDLGSSSLHLWVVDLVDGNRETVHLARASLRLVNRWTPQARGITLGSAQIAAEAINAMVATCRDFGCDHIQIAATSAVRDAQGNAEFCDQVHSETGIVVRVLSGIDEANIGFLGVLPHLNLSDGPALVFDLGGGSTELIVGDQSGPQWVTSLPLGHLRCSQAISPSSDPPGPQATERLKNLVAQVIAPSLLALQDQTWHRLVGISGTVWTLSRVLEGHCQRAQPSGRAAPRVALHELADLRARLQALPTAALAQLPGMDKRRCDSFYAGVVAVEALMESLECKTLWTAKGGLREGLVADFERSRLS
jgi:exopolyphosphatase/guanosine-5'-triphosphate,3'-diphosphate pyrophosphatase